MLCYIMGEIKGNLLFVIMVFSYYVDRKNDSFFVNFNVSTDFHNLLIKQLNTYSVNKVHVSLVLLS